MSNLAQTLVSRIASHIVQTGLKPGDRLTERKLAELFRVSRSPVRVALKRLEDEGVLAAGERSGYRVVDVAAARAVAMPRADIDLDEHLYLRIADDRLRGELPDRITENELQRRYDVARGRLAGLLRRMSHEGWIERLPGHGWEFLPVLTSLEAYGDSYRFRQAIEPAALLEPRFRLDRSALLARLDEQQWLIQGGIWTVAPARLFELNSGLHRSIIECSGNAFFVDALKRVDRLRRLIEYRQMLDRDQALGRCLEHVELLHLVLQGRNEQASDLMRRHLAALGPLKSRARGDASDT